MEGYSAEQLFQKAVDEAAYMKFSGLAGMIANLGRESEFSFSDEVESISILKSGQGHQVRFSKRFVEKFIVSERDILFLVSHEILEKAREQTEERNGRQNPLDKFVLDLINEIIINSRLCSQYFSGPVSFFDRVYRPEVFPDLLLMPPANLACASNDDARANICHGDFLRLPMESWLESYSSLFTRAKDLPASDSDGHHRSVLWQIGKGSISFGLAIWYWQAWSLSVNYSPVVLYQALRPLFTRFPDILLLGDHSA